MSNKVVTLDVRPDLKSGREPFSKIMQTVAALGADQSLKLIAPFEPAPLYGILAQQGFAHTSTETPEGDFEVLFSRGEPEAEPEPVKPSTVPAKACTGSPVMDVDARGLEPPQPLVTILEALSKLPAGAKLRAHTDRRPMHLYAQLEQRGFRGSSEEQADGSFVTLIEPVTGKS
jgi:uncharacterized protein (DUF2249 family)